MTKVDLILNLNTKQKNKKQEHKKCKRKVQIDFYYEKNMKPYNINMKK
jgi:hypothetical protein